MSANPTAYHLSEYTVVTPVYEGPLDLLLQLIERAELDITTLALAQVTDQYLEHIHTLSNLLAEQVSSFLVVAARLLQIKSEALLPRPPTREAGEEDPGLSLARQLLAYKRYRQIADLLAAREVAGLRTYLRLAPPPKIEGTLDLSGVSLDDLVSAAHSALVQNNKPALASIVAPPRITIREKISHIANILRHQKSATFLSLFSKHSTRLEIVVTFLAMLELIKRHLLRASQSTPFGEIEIETAEEWDQNDDFELEFGE